MSFIADVHIFLKAFEVVEPYDDYIEIPNCVGRRQESNTEKRQGRNKMMRKEQQILIKKYIAKKRITNKKSRPIKTCSKMSRSRRPKKTI